MCETQLAAAAEINENRRKVGSWERKVVLVAHALFMTSYKLLVAHVWLVEEQQHFRCESYVVCSVEEP